MNGVVRVNKNLSVSRAIGDAGVRGLLLPPLFRAALLSRCAVSCSYSGSCCFKSRGPCHCSRGDQQTAVPAACRTCAACSCAHTHVGEACRRASLSGG